tara:strand:+ start:358 stop:1071 length:714 start_codon:yes stop_codon:yes gene_type:complete
MSKIRILNNAGTLLESLATGYMEVSAFYQKPEGEAPEYQEFDPITIMECYNIWNVDEPPGVEDILEPMFSAYPAWTENDSVNTSCQFASALQSNDVPADNALAFFAAIEMTPPEEGACEEEETSEEVIVSAGISNGVLDTTVVFGGGDWPPAELAATTLKLVVAPSVDVLDGAFYTETVVVLPVTSKLKDEGYSISDIPDVIDIKLNQITRTKRENKERRDAINVVLATRAQNKVEG